MADRVAVVTGASGGIGRATARALARNGFAVVVTAREVGRLDATVDELRTFGAAVEAVACEVTDEGSIAAVAAAAHGLGVVHTVVANAGVPGPVAPLHEVTAAQWRDCLATNLDGVFLTFRAFLPGLMQRRAGSLIAVGSMTGKRPMANRGPYAASKLGLIGLVRTLATELGPSGVRANCVCPGPVDSERLDTLARRNAERDGISEAKARAAFTAISPMGRAVTADEVAATCAFLASDAAAGITGEDLNVSAGAVMH
ncbi:short-chain dehydrogenase [Pseudonocardia sulfidoxydans NBRC 16205]|uniref:Short-chain dehydrogenase n=1 Tax=Pseudonocardia sulfidoxydans NBRC 16205 TaxID=1223511 RepID=A0A511D9J4_9PSEU|nr:SDR family NAD(P)-dependent oxidoreductase [Pseudonocardia sulfidoxydans]GEL21479.1 short-chain dehydrogenase [Pseudonocardia sulfidoxydans NBRC 16205]